MVWCYTATSKFGLSSSKFFYALPLPFICLLSGAFISTAGTFQSVSQVIALPTKGKGGGVATQDFNASPRASNLVTFGTPLVVAAAVLACTIVNGIRFSE